MPKNSLTAPIDSTTQATRNLSLSGTEVQGGEIKVIPHIRVPAFAYPVAARLPLRRRETHSADTSIR